MYLVARCFLFAEYETDDILVFQQHQSIEVKFNQVPGRDKDPSWLPVEPSNVLGYIMIIIYIYIYTIICTYLCTYTSWAHAQMAMGQTHSEYVYIYIYR